MTPHQILLANLVRTAVFLILVGLVVRRRAAVCWTFVAYLSTILVCNSLISFWPEIFFTKAFYLLKAVLAETGKTAICKIVLKDREQLAALNPFEKTMLLQTLRVLEGYDIAAMDPAGPEFVHTIVEALK